MLGGVVALFAALSAQIPAAEPAKANIYCVSERCLAAQAAEQAAQQKAMAAAQNAASYQDEVDKLSSEIAQVQSQIDYNAAIAADLKIQIDANEQRLDQRQSVLAGMIVDAYVRGNTSPIEMLATSTSVGDFIEQQSRDRVAKEQITKSAEEIRAIKAELEQQKREIDRIIFDQEAMRKDLDTRRAAQLAFVNKYKNDQSKYLADAASNKKIKDAEIIARANEIANNNKGGIVVAAGNNSYKYRNVCPRDNLKYLVVGGYVCQCTSYAGWKVLERWGITITAWGDAKNWANSAAAPQRNYKVGTTPKLHSVAVNPNGQWGHVMWVEAVNPDGTFDLSEYNNSSSSLSKLPGDFGYRIKVSPAGLKFIYFDE
jgi:surface antigen